MTFTNVGALFVLDLHPLTQAARCWGLNNSILKIPQLCDNISHDLYTSIKDNLTMPDGNTFAMNELIAAKINSVFVSSDSFALDEMLIKFYGKFKFKHHMPKKPAKIGLKTFVIACSESKIPFDFVFHDNSMPKTENMNTIDGMVYNVISRNIESGTIREYSTLYTDNYFTTHWLLKKLKSINIHFIGTVKANYVPPAVQQHHSFIQFKKESKRMFDEATNKVTCPSLCIVYDEIYYTLINDNNLFCMATNNMHYVNLGFTENSALFANKHRKEIGSTLGHKAIRRIPCIVDMYNYRMNSIDVLDQYIESYNRHQTHPSWKVQIYMSAFQLMEVTAYNMYKSKHSNPMTHWDFKLSVALSLLMSRNNHVRAAQTISSDIFLSSEHPMDSHMHSKSLLTLGRLAECKYQIKNENPKSKQRFPMKNCGKRTNSGCRDCLWKNEPGMHLCKRHLVIHKEEST